MCWVWLNVTSFSAEGFCLLSPPWPHKGLATFFDISGRRCQTLLLTLTLASRNWGQGEKEGQHIPAATHVTDWTMVTNFPRDISSFLYTSHFYQCAVLWPHELITKPPHSQPPSFSLLAPCSNQQPLANKKRTTEQSVPLQIPMQWCFTGHWYLKIRWEERRGEERWRLVENKNLVRADFKNSQPSNLWVPNPRIWRIYCNRLWASGDLESEKGPVSNSTQILRDGCTCVSGRIKNGGRGKYNCHTTQQSHCWAYKPRKPELKETRVPQCWLQHCLQQLGHGSSLDGHRPTTG